MEWLKQISVVISVLGSSATVLGLAAWCAPRLWLG